MLLEMIPESMANELKYYLVPFHYNGKIPNLNEVISHAKDTKEFSVPIIEDKSNQVQSISNSLVYDPLKNHEISGDRKLTKKLKRLVPIHSNRKIPNLKEVISHTKDTKKFSAPIKMVEFLKE